MTVARDGFAYARARTTPGEYYAPVTCATRAEATRGGAFDTISANGVMTFDARTCVGVAFTPTETWTRERAVFERMRAMRTFAEHRVRKSFALMREHARARKFAAMRRALEGSSAVFGRAFAERTIPAMLRVRAACETIGREARLFRRERVASRDADASGADAFAFEEFEGETDDVGAAETYDADALAENFQRNAMKSRDVLATVTRDVEREIQSVKSDVEERFLDDLNDRLRPMLATTMRFRRRSSGSGKFASSSKSDAASADPSSTASTAPRDAHPHTERVLKAALHEKLDSFERSAWMAMRSELAAARKASLEDFASHVACSSSDSANAALFEVCLSDGTTELVPSIDALERTIRSGASMWTSASLRSADSSGERMFPLYDEDAFDEDVHQVCDAVREAFARASEDVSRTAARLCSRAAALETLDDDADDVERFESAATRAKEFKRVIDEMGDSIRPRGGCFAVNVRSLKGELKSAVAAVESRASAGAVECAHDRAQSIATSLTKLKIDAANHALGDEIGSERARALRARASELGDAYATLRRLGCKIPDLHAAAFDALTQEIDAFIEKYEAAYATNACGMQSG